MPEITIAIELLLVALAVALVTRRTGRPYTVALVIWGLILGFVDLLDPIHLSKDLILAVFLPPLLFEGALHIREAVLRARAGIVFGLALVGTLITAGIVGLAAHLLLGFDVLVALLIGVMVAPTDPVSVLATFRNLVVDRELSTIVEAESLFNDGIAVVLYVVLLEALGGISIGWFQGAGGFVLTVLGGALVGLGTAALASQLLRRVEDSLVQVLVTLIVVYGSYLLAEHLGVSGVIAVGVGGLWVGNRGLPTLSSEPGERVISYWEITVFLVNSVVFLLIGFELQLDRLLQVFLVAGAVFLVLLVARAMIVYGLGWPVDRLRSNFPLSWRHVVFWGGMRGAVPIALALGLPASLPDREVLIAIVFGVVFFSLLLQGLTMPRLVRALKLQPVTPGGSTPYLGSGSR